MKLKPKRRFRRSFNTDHLYDLILEPDIAVTIRQFCKERGVQKAWKRRAEFQVRSAATSWIDFPLLHLNLTQVNEIHEAYISRICNIMHDSYCSTEEDVILLWKVTTGILVGKYLAAGMTFEILTSVVKGTSEKRWVYCCRKDSDNLVVQVLLPS